MITVENMLTNMAVASQHKPLLDDVVVRGAVLRTIHQWLHLSPTGVSTDELCAQLRNHSDFNK